MSQHKQPDPVEGTVTSDAVQGKKLLTKKLWLIGAGLVIVIILVTAGIVYRNITQESKASVHNIVQSQSATLKPKQELAKAQTELHNASTPIQKATADENLAGAYIANNQDSAAITAYQNAITADSSTKANVLGPLAYTYVVSGQRDQAIATYQELLALLQQLKQGQQGNQYTNTESPVQAIQQDIQTLENGGNLW